MSDSHQMIIYHVCKIIGRITVGFDQDHIIQLCIVYCNIPIDLIMKNRLPLHRVILPDHIGYA